jgi:ABC-type sugar transport system substrate-binding protein
MTPNFPSRHVVSIDLPPPVQHADDQDAVGGDTVERQVLAGDEAAETGGDVLSRDA